MPWYEVPVMYRGQCNFRVEADNPDQAQEKAQIAFKNNEATIELGNEWEEIQRVGQPIRWRAEGESQ